MITKQTALYLMLGGAALSLYDMMGTGNPLYGAGMPLEKLRWKVYTTTATPPKDLYVSISDAAALIGAIFYFK